MKTLPPCDHDGCPITGCLQTANAKGVGISEWLAAINGQLDIRVEEMKQEFRECKTDGQKHCLGTAIITVNAIAWALNDARNKMAANS